MKKTSEKVSSDTQVDTQAKGKKIYLVSQGDYSDYHIVGAFSTHKKAKAFVDRFTVDREYDAYFKNYRIASYDIDALEPAARKDMIWVHLVMGRDGRTWNVTTGPDVPNKPMRELYRNDRLMVTVEAKDVAHAVKIANEIRTRMIARGEWPEERVNE